MAITKHRLAESTVRRATITALLLALALCDPRLGSTKDKPQKATTPLSTDEIAIYKAVLQQYSSKEGQTLNVSAKTYPLDADSPINSRSGDDCLKGIKLENLAAVSHSFHELPPEVLGKGMALVDPDKQSKTVRRNDPSKTIRKGKSVANAVQDAFSTGLFSISEIAFDKERHFGVVTYNFWCGSLCGNGATLVFEEINGEWKNSSRLCRKWIS